MITASQRPTWASKLKTSTTELRQRIIVFIVGGATYSESRSCYEVSKKWNRDVILGSTELITPQLFISELARARESRQNLNLSMDQVRSVPPPVQPPQPQQGGLPSRPSPASPNIPPSMRPGQPQGTSPSRNGGMGGPRPIPGHTKSPPPHLAHTPGHGTPPPSSHHHKSTGSKDSKEEKKEKKKKKFGMF